MKTFILFILSIATMAQVNSQNLVQNSNFENLVSEPCGLICSSADFESAMNDWVVANNGTPDIFLTTVTQLCWNNQPNSTYPGVIGIKGSQDPHSGNSFVGVFAYTIDGLNQRDYIQVELNSPMQSGVSYVVEFYVSLADSTEYAIDNFGAHLSTLAISSNDDGILDYEAQIEFDDFVSDTQNWVRIADTIIADDNYEYITIGNFNTDANTSTLENPTSSGGIGCYGAYYYVDDVSIVQLQNTGLNEISMDKSIKVFPVPFFKYISIDSEIELQNAIVTFYDQTGRMILTNDYHTLKEVKIDTNALPNGYYIIEVKHNKGVFQKKILKSN